MANPPNLVRWGEIRERNMKIEKCLFEYDRWGFYLTPLIGYSNTPKLGKSIWIGWGRWLWTIKLK